ncbi:hypothetical protein F5884DRAFT_386509 [Xylogone sp. PMI_703]|nr:hypothetical protein F5884DRAFT_386509 [Xylogone sp. PMI_703]
MSNMRSRQNSTGDKPSGPPSLLRPTLASFVEHSDDHDMPRHEQRGHSNSAPQRLSPDVSGLFTHSLGDPQPKQDMTESSEEGKSTKGPNNNGMGLGRKQNLALRLRGGTGGAEPQGSSGAEDPSKVENNDSPGQPQHPPSDPKGKGKERAVDDSSDPPQNPPSTPGSQGEHNQPNPDPSGGPNPDPDAITSIPPAADQPPSNPNENQGSGNAPIKRKPSFFNKVPGSQTVRKKITNTRNFGSKVWRSISSGAPQAESDRSQGNTNRQGSGPPVSESHVDIDEASGGVTAPPRRKEDSGKPYITQTHVNWVTNPRTINLVSVASRSVDLEEFKQMIGGSAGESFAFEVEDLACPECVDEMRRDAERKQSSMQKSIKTWLKNPGCNHQPEVSNFFRSFDQQRRFFISIVLWSEAECEVSLYNIASAIHTVKTYLTNIHDIEYVIDKSDTCVRQNRADPKLLIYLLRSLQDFLPDRANFRISRLGIHNEYNDEWNPRRGWLFGSGRSIFGQKKQAPTSA